MSIQMGYSFWSGVWRHHQHVKENKMPLEMDMALDPWNQPPRSDGECSTRKLSLAERKKSPAKVIRGKVELSLPKQKQLQLTELVVGSRLTKRGTDLRKGW